MEPTGAAPLRPTDLRAIGPYRLLGRLGEGGMGTVFLARAPTGRFVALKVVKAEFANQEGFAARFHAEVDNARRVASFCTAQVLDNGNTGDGRPYMVTEYIAGTPLSDQISKYGALEPGPLHGVALGVAAALAAIHVAELVHRDLKPANVILSLSGPRVIDFGIARALDRETGFTLSGELLGSPGWWAPEQVRGELVSPAADIFAWGCLIAYAGNGRHPFGRGDPITMASRVLNTPPELGALPAPLNDLVRRATSMDPALRPTAQDLLIALVGGSAPMPAAADPPTLVATEMLSDWQPPQNVVDEPDITATFTTPPPSDATGHRGTAPGSPTAASAATGPGGPHGASGAHGVGGSSGLGGAGGVDGTGSSSSAGGGGVPSSAGVSGFASGPGAGEAPSLEERARREEEAAKQELARWQVPGQAGAPRRRPGLFRGKAAKEETGQPEQEPAQSWQGTGAGFSQQGSGQGFAQPSSGPGLARPGAVSGAGRPETGHVQRGGGLGADTHPGTVGSPADRGDDTDDTIGGTRTAGTRWLIAAAAAVLAIVVTVAVLIVTSARDTVTTVTPGTPTQVGGSPSPNDVGRRFALGAGFDDPVAIVTAVPECGLKEFEGVTSAKGQLCVIRWTMLNPGGERRVLVQPVVTMVDDRGGEHDPAPVTLPPAILPGGRVDSAFVFDLAMYRKPMKMTATLLENGKLIEVTL
ncbi:serine/threonine protein kinase [Nonomuraea gerenzanensis]|nr:serine/threonine-protein kinase [Nonomuraea gerenzanensis]UBU19109.1 serine/threonine protein kinase [Nonomuraea gerenzanensis]